MAILFATSSHLRWGIQESEAFILKYSLKGETVDISCPAEKFTSSYERFCTIQVSVVSGDFPFLRAFINEDISVFSKWTYVGLDGRIASLDSRFSSPSQRPIASHPQRCWWYDGEILTATSWTLERLVCGFLLTGPCASNTHVASLKLPLEWAISDARDLPDFEFSNRVFEYEARGWESVGVPVKKDVLAGAIPMPSDIGGEFVQGDTRIPCFMIDIQQVFERCLLLCSPEQIPVAGPFQIERSIVEGSKTGAIRTVLGSGALSGEQAKQIQASIAPRPCGGPPVKGESK